MIGLSRTVRFLATTLLGISIAQATALGQECQSLLDEFNRAIDSGDDDLAQRAVDTIATSSECGRY
jgi:hypothetical protein